jgi:SanA protein
MVKTTQKRIWRLLVAGLLLAVVAIFLINSYVNSVSKSLIYKQVTEVPSAYTAIVLGTKVTEDGRLSYYLAERMQTAVELYKQQKIKRFLLTGDHGEMNYDEVNSMKTYLLNQGVPIESIFLDHAGFDTYSSMARAKAIFQVTDAVIVTQAFHLPRALYIAQNKGIKARGLIADKQERRLTSSLKFREVFANVKAFIEVNLNVAPKFLGDPIPITGDSRLSHDEKN